MNKILPNLNPKIPKVKIITKRSEQKLEDEINKFIKNEKIAIKDLIDIKFSCSCDHCSVVIIYETQEI